MPWAQRSLTVGLSLVLTTLIMTAIMTLVWNLSSNTKVLGALADSTVKLTELNEKIGNLTNDNVRKRRDEATAWRQLMEFCKKGDVKPELCKNFPDEQTLKLLER